MVCIFLADGFEMIEALTPCDLLRRAGLDVRLVSVSGAPVVRSSHRVAVTADMTLDAVDPAKVEMMLLPGGMPGAEHLYENTALREMVKRHAEKGLPTAAICAAPFILGRLGLLRGRKATCYPGFEKDLAGAFVTPGGVVRDGNLLTARGMGVSFPFGLAAVAMLLGEEKARTIAASVMAE